VTRQHGKKSFPLNRCDIAEGVLCIRKRDKKQQKEKKTGLRKATSTKERQKNDEAEMEKIVKSEDSAVPCAQDVHHFALIVAFGG
jgi:hypothetical protein